MDPYIRDCNYVPVDTLEVDNAFELTTAITAQDAVNFDFKLIHQNIRSIARNLDHLKVYLTQFDFDFDCLVLTETWRICDLSVFHREGYDLFYSKGDFNKADGVLVYVKKIFNGGCSLIDIGQSRAVQLEIKTNRGWFYVTALYRSPSTCVNDFIDQFESYLCGVNSNNISCHIIVGDINIDILDNSETTFNYISILREHNFSSLINKTTRPPKSCLDHVFVRFGNKDAGEVCCPFVLKSHITDHHSTVVFFALGVFGMPTKNIEKNTFKEYIKYPQLRGLLRSHDWDTFYSENLVENATAYFVDTLQSMIKKSTVRVKVAKQDVKRKCWITIGLIKAISRRDQMYKLWQSNPNDNVLKSNFTAYRNVLNTLIKNAKISYYKNLIYESKGDNRNMWNVINKNFTSKNTKSDSIKQITYDSVDIFDSNLIANIFNKHFTEIGERLARDISPPADFHPPRHIVPHSIYLNPATVAEIKSIIGSLKSKKASGYDKIKAEVLRQVNDEIAPLLCSLINRIIESGQCPTHFKIAVVRPLHKSGTKKEVNNYRPISLISNLSKIFEKVIKSRLLSFLNRYENLSERQFGFREGRSTQDAIALLTSNIYAAMDINCPALCVFLDLAKAFDTLCHDRLLEALENSGIRGTANKLLSSYLSGRQQCVEVNSVVSGRMAVNYGVPQGTVLGPLLFLIYMNSLLSINVSSTVLSFADDTVLFCKGDTWESVKRIVENDMLTIARCLAHMQLTLNVGKTVCVPFTPYVDKLPNYNRLTFGDSGKLYEVKIVEHTTYLGVVIDRHLRWNFHIQNVITSLQNILYRFKVLTRILDLPQIKCIYYSLVQSRLSYGILAWGGLADIHLNQLEVLQKRFLKIMLKKGFLYPTNLLYEESKIMDLRQLYFFQLIVYHYKNRFNLPVVDHPYLTRARERVDAKTPFSAKKIGQRCHVFLSPRCYNILPGDLRTQISLRTLKVKLKKFILTSNRYTFTNIIRC